MDERTMQLIVECAERCERTLALESTYVMAGDLASAALCADVAESDSCLAFVRATCGRVYWTVGE